MKIRLVSDLHLEHRYLSPPLFDNAENADVLIMAGDIMVANVFTKKDKYFTDVKDSFNKFLSHVSSQFGTVLWVLGNHEHYHGDVSTTYDILKEACSPFSNIHVLEKETFILDDVTFIGGTCWTNFLNNNPDCHQEVGMLLNDYRQISNIESRVKSYWDEFKEQWIYTGGKLTTEYVYNDHLKFMEYAESELNKLKQDDRCVMITHHGMSLLSIHEKYKNDTMLNGGFVSDLSDFILNHPQIKFAVHGHVHDPMDYLVGNTRIIANPMGYPNETYQHMDDYKLVIFEL